MKISAIAASLLLLAGLLAAAPAASTRHVVYAFAVNPSARVTAPDTNFSGTDTGTMRVDILGTAPDGGTLVQTTERWWNAVRSRQSLQCEVYPGGKVTCPLIPQPSAVALTLLPLLASDFYRGRARWHQRYTMLCGAYSDSCSVDIAYAASPPSNGLVGITAQGQLVTTAVRRWTVHQQGTISYDPSAQLPTLVHDVRTGTSGSVFHSRTVDLKLLDSAAAR